ncbi:MAG: tyrosine-type recombinase/integrase [Muribaculaceae bacterium]|nr:tyrosine-type recombinase/integrase [Muribaculaceae bacterium]
MIHSRFRQYLSLELNRSRLTVEAYMRDIDQFESWITSGATERFDPASVTLSDIRAWLASIGRSDSPSTLRRKTQSLRSFFRWMLKEGIVASNPAADVTLAKKGKHLPEFVRESEMEEILSLPEGNDYRSVRDRLILTILYSTGIRQAELLALRDSDISFSAKEAKVTGKRNKQRIIPLPSRLLDEIKRWQEIRNRRHPDLKSPVPLFPGEKGPLSKMTLYKIVKNGLASTSSAAKSPHVLRHTFATSMLNHGANLDMVKEMLGHASLTTTEIYTHLSFDQLKKNYAQAHPRARDTSKGGKQEEGAATK